MELKTKDELAREIKRKKMWDAVLPVLAIIFLIVIVGLIAN